jgi:transcriptional regulator with XRE-family HTH domain
MSEQTTPTKVLSPFKQLRMQSGLTQAELAKLIPDKRGIKSISQRAISAWERGEYEPELTIKQTKALCQALGVTLDQLVTYFSSSENPEEMVN